MRLLIALLTAIALLATTGDASADTPSPTPAGGTINVRFLRDGAPATITYVGHVPDVFANGERCFLGKFTADVSIITANSFTWEWPPRSAQASAACSFEGATIRVVFETFIGTGTDIRFVYLTSEFTWNGGDAWGDLDVDAGVPIPSPTPTPVGQTPSPTEIPTPQPDPSEVTFRFVRAGVPVFIPTPALTVALFLGEQACSAVSFDGLPPGQAGMGQVTVSVIQAAPCNLQPPATLRAEFEVYIGAERLTFSSAFVWTGADMNVDVEVPASIPVITTTASSARLPATGGPPPSGNTPPMWLAPFGLALIAAAWLAARRARI